jgi:hypothetical protein
VWLRWDTAALAAAALVVFSVALRAARRPAAVAAGALARETAIVLGLYAVWQWAGAFAVTKVTGAEANGRAIWHAERLLRLPSELWLQRAFLPHPLLVQALNVFYAVVHVPALIIFLLWLFVRHRDVYARWRNVGAVLTGACLLIQMVPVAPPRLLPALGFVDTGLRYGQSVYGPHGITIAPQLAAMPSVHVAWSVFIATSVVAVSPSPRRWLVVLHPLLTVLAVVATGNHWWADGVVAAGLLPMAVLAVRGASAVLATKGGASVVAPIQWRHAVDGN